MKTISKLKIGQKLTLAFGLVMLMFIINVIVSVYSINSVYGRFTNFYEDQLQVVQASEEFLIHIEGFGKSISRMAIASIEDLNI